VADAAYSVDSGWPPALRSVAMRSREIFTGTVSSASPWKFQSGVLVAAAALSSDALPQQLSPHLLLIVGTLSAAAVEVHHERWRLYRLYSDSQWN
jgi:hypothetical protein